MSDISATATELLHDAGFDEAAFGEHSRPARNERGSDWPLAALFFGIVATMYGVIGVVVYSVIA